MPAGHNVDLLNFDQVDQPMAVADHGRQAVPDDLMNIDPQVTPGKAVANGLMTKAGQRGQSSNGVLQLSGKQQALVDMADDDQVRVRRTFLRLSVCNDVV